MNTDKPHFLSKKTTQLADEISLHFMLVEVLFERHGIWSNVTNVASGLADFEIATPQPPADAIRLDLMMLVTEAAAVHLNWFNKPGRIAFSVHPDMVSNLRGSTSKKLPGNVFRHMVHSSPLVLFSRPVPTTTMADEPAHLHGFFVYGIAGDVRKPGGWSICETDDEAMAALGMMMIIAPTADLEDMQFDSLVIPLTDVFTVDDAVAETTASYNIDENHQDIDADAYRRRSEEALVLALNVLLYICDDEADHEPMAAPRTGSGNRGRRARRRTFGTSTRFIASGWVEGPALEAAHARQSKGKAQRGGSSGWEQGFHRRRGHFRPVRWGKGRAASKIKWIKPYSVRKDKADAAAARLITVAPENGRGRRHGGDTVGR